MNINQSSNKPAWERPWNREKFDSLSYKDDRFFSIVIKGALSWLTRNIILYNKPIKHFIYNTGSSVMYVETNGYEMSWSETTGEDQIYMSKPRCVVSVGDIEIETSELTQPHIRGVYERECVYKDGNNSVIRKQTEGFNAEIRRIPVTLHLDLNYVLSSFNESIVLTEELVSKFLFQQYYNVVYLGQTVMCSVELPQSFKIETNKIDMTSAETNQKTISVSLNICCNYPRINEATEISNSAVIQHYTLESDLYGGDTGNVTDKLGNIESSDADDENETADIRKTSRIKQNY